MRNILPQRKKAVSEIVSYTLLIIIAVAAGALVFSYLKIYVPKDNPVCPQDISLVASDIQCTYSSTDPSKLSITFSNRGRFTIDAAYVRIGKPDKDTRNLINGDREDDFYFVPRLAPSQLPIIKIFDVKQSVINSPGNYILEIQPAVFDDKLDKLAPCQDAVITQTISCDDTNS